MVWEKQTPDANGPFRNIPAIDGSDIDLRRELGVCLGLHGHEVFLRSPTDQKCPSHNTDDAFKEFDTTCEFCQGFGFVYTDKRVRAYRRPAFGTFGFTGAAMRFEPGTLGAEDTVWYFAHVDTPVVGHHVIEVRTDDTGTATKPFRIERTHEIHQAHLTRERQGRPEFWEVLVRARRLGK